MGRSAGFLGVLLSSLFAALAPAVRGEDLSARHALLIDVKGAIGYVSTSQLTRALEKANAEEASLLIMRLDTPGGLLSSTRDMVQAMLASPVPIVVYVAPSGARAASAGTYLVYASHVAAMAPGTHLGAATPIPLGVPGLPGSPPPSKPLIQGPGKTPATRIPTSEEKQIFEQLKGWIERENPTLAEIQKKVEEIRAARKLPVLPAPRKQ